MKLTYTIDQSIALQSGDGYFDLHSDYELVSALPNGSRCYLHFMKRTAAWVKTPDPSHLALVFEQVDYFQVSETIQLPTSIEKLGSKSQTTLIQTGSWNNPKWIQCTSCSD